MSLAVENLRVETSQTWEMTANQFSYKAWERRKGKKSMVNFGLEERSRLELEGLEGGREVLCCLEIAASPAMKSQSKGS